MTILTDTNRTALTAKVAHLYTQAVLASLARFADGADINTPVKYPQVASGSYKYGEWSEVRRFLRHAPGTVGSPSDPQVLCPDYLLKVAAEFGAAQVAGMEAKLATKLGAGFTVTSAKLDTQGRFTITGLANGHDVAVRQEVVYKVSSKGRPFIQWPARIDVDGKFTPAARYAAAIA